MSTWKVAGILSLIGLMLLPAAAMAAGSCKNVDITIQNHTGGEFKIKKIWHYDYGSQKWRTNIASNRNLANNYSTTYRKDLQKVKGEMTRVAVLYYQYDIQVERWAQSASFACHKGDSVVVNADEPGTMAIFERPPMEGRPVVN